MGGAEMARAGVGRAAAHHQRGHYPVSTVREAGRLDCAMTNREARPHLVKPYKGMESPGFNGHVHAGTRDVDGSGGAQR